METVNDQNKTGNEKLLIHSLDKEENINYFAMGESFETIRNEENPSQNIGFSRQFKFHKDDFKEVKKPAEILSPFEPMLTYHNFIAVYWKISLMFTKNNTFDVIVSYIGPTKKVNDIPKGSLGPNFFHKQTAPVSIKGNVKVGHKINDHFECCGDEQLTPMGTTVKVYVASNVVKKDDLDEILKTSDFLYLDVSIVINKDYFNIDNFVKNALGTGSGKNEMTLATVLRKEKHGTCDFVFTVGEASKNNAVDFFVHKSILSQTSPTLANIFSGTKTVSTDQLCIISNENRIVFPFLSENDMKIILTYLYSGDVELPKFDSYAKVGRVLSILVSKNDLLEIFKQWDQQMANFLLDLNRENDDEKMITATVKSLIAIYSAPFGALPLSKRISVAILASKINEYNVTQKNIFESQELRGIISRCNIDRQLNSVMEFKYHVICTKKEYVK
ncbi:BTB/POZ-like domain and BTB/POZ fold domain and BTB/POZ domain-containing protein [Strongyloides ratti]|uniref:BTB/POZ-like domain and BTB/POZ fold domain and BTB/POZ domain-containing protein n=1 Tax=Strongyloides ratti TaxID=34506 RepID=A0A090MWA8_STRRB|nr:BTB/POZ-like domain and BTB/POZ fold domain and BTB/POZ domain-containing protein [Strongyloides ratti]CEF63584.1 BTB/POZ-like domain and BTB/POZ fold domain and BTB/POZ domain-containing protein [Strongyloides ratti]